MAVLHLLRSTRSGGLISRVRAGLLFLSGLTLLACSSQEPVVTDQMLQDSLGLSPDAPVTTIRLVNADGAEALAPDSISVEVGFWVDFLSADGFPRAVVFSLDSLSPGGRSFITSLGLQGSPPLLGEGVHWVVDFSEAPPGRYPYRVEGTGEPAYGVIRVEIPS